MILSNQAHCFGDKNDGDLDFLRIPKYFLVDNGHFADEKSWHEGMTLFNRITKETAETFSIPFVDQVSAFQGKPTQEYFKDAHHMTHKGRELKARLFYEKIVELNLLKEKRD